MKTQDSPHYEVPSTELARWLEQQGPGCWWSIDGDPFLTGFISFPCPSNELAATLKKKNQPLLMLDKDLNPEAKGQLIGADDLNRLAFLQKSGDRVFQFCWKLTSPWIDYGPNVDWNLVEDKETARERAEEDALEDEETTRAKSEPGTPPSAAEN